MIRDYLERKLYSGDPLACYMAGIVARVSSDKRNDLLDLVSGLAALGLDNDHQRAFWLLRGEAMQNAYLRLEGGREFYRIHPDAFREKEAELARRGERVEA